jgi:hypothetical protein
MTVSGETELGCEIAFNRDPTREELSLNLGDGGDQAVPPENSVCRWNPQIPHGC